MCEYKSKSERYLKKHISLEHSGQKFDCDKCSSSKLGKQEMIVHKKKNHKDIKTHQTCTICKKNIRTKYFYLHTRIHDKSKQFICSKCSAVFLQHEYLIRHIRQKCIGFREDELLLKLESLLLDESN